jgi:hypothetical protein
MDNYFQECPPMMDDGRLFTDYRSPQIREEIFRHKHCVASENEARTLRTEHAEQIMDDEWYTLREKSCYPRKNCFHKHPTTRVTTPDNIAEILAYNGQLPAPSCDPASYDFRMTSTKGSKTAKADVRRTKQKSPQSDFYGYPVRCARTHRMNPESLNLGQN